MRRPATTRDRAGIHGYVVAPALAWSGWRLRVPGGPEGGQYHGYTGDDSDQESTMLSGPSHAWNPVWGGTRLLEGETVSDHVYRSPGEVRPRANASGGANVLREYQTERSPGYAEAPGNYRALGYDDPLLQYGWYGSQPSAPQPQQGWPAGATDLTLPFPSHVCPEHMIACPSGSVTQYSNDSCHSPVGCTPSPNTVAQPPAAAGPSPVNTVSAWSVPPVSPAPAPTVASSPEDYLPAAGQPLPSAAAASPNVDIGAWLKASTIWSVVPNWALVAAGAFLLFRGKK